MAKSPLTTLIPVPSLTPKPGAEVDPIEHEVAKTLRLQRGLMASRFGLIDPAQAGPAATTPNELAKLAETTATIAKTQADLMREEAEYAQQRRAEAEQRVGEAAEAARADEANKWNVVLEVTQRSFETVTDLLKAQQSTVLAAKDTEYAATVARLEAKFDATVAELKAQHARELAERDRQLAEVRAAADKEIAQIKADYETRAQLADRDREIERLRAQAAGQDPAQVYVQAWYESQADKVRKEAAKIELDIERERKRTERVDDVIDMAVENVPKLVNLLSAALIGAPPAGLPRNGLPANPPSANGAPAAPAHVQ